MIALFIFLQKIVGPENIVAPKYSLRPPRDLRSKFLLEMEQREIDKDIADKLNAEEEMRKQLQQMEVPPEDDLHGLRVHAWVLLRAGEKDIAESIFVEPSTGASHPIDSPLYCWIESLWNHENYWVQCSSIPLAIVLICYIKGEHARSF